MYKYNHLVATLYYPWFFLFQENACTNVHIISESNQIQTTGVDVGACGIPSHYKRNTRKSYSQEMSTFNLHVGLL